MSGKNSYMAPISYTASELAASGGNAIPAGYQTGTHLIYSSPATLAFNSPGAEGFGVKRAGLAIPGSVMLIVSPGCCGRNTSGITDIPGYRNRFFYLNMDETDLVTGRHLRKIPAAAKEIYDFLEEKPSILMICITCVDALLGTDMERVCRNAEREIPIPVRPCYMYALTREGRKPPMVHVRDSIYSLLPEQKKRGTTVNFLGFFAPVQPDFELFGMLREIGVKKINEIARCRDIADFYSMGEANFNLVLNPEARYAAEKLQERLSVPYIELTRLYQTDQIEKQYAALSAALGTALSIDTGKVAAEEALESFRQKHPHCSFAVGESMDGNPFELATALLRYGFRVPVIYGNPQPAYMVYIRKIAEMSPDTEILSNMDPGMLYFDEENYPADAAIGKDAAFYHPHAVQVHWNQDEQPFGYSGVALLFRTLEEAFQKGAV